MRKFSRLFQLFIDAEIPRSFSQPPIFHHVPNRPHHIYASDFNVIIQGDKLVPAHVKLKATGLTRLDPGELIFKNYFVAGRHQCVGIIIGSILGDIKNFIPATYFVLWHYSANPTPRDL